MKLPLLFLSLVIFSQACQSDSTENPAKDQSSVFVGCDSPSFQYTGRFLTDKNALRFAWSGSRIDFRFTGPAITVLLTPSPGAESAPSDTIADFYHLLLDGKEYTRRLTSETPLSFSGLRDSTHSLTIFKRTEALVAEGIFEGVMLDPGQKLLLPHPLPTRKIEFIGNSITCGYGNEGDSRDCRFSPETENAWLTYSHLTAQNLSAQYVSVCYSGKGVYQNYDQTREQLMPELWRKYSPIIEEEWHFGWAPEVVVVNLGTNDFAHGTPPQEEFVLAYSNFISEIIQQYPETKIVCLTGSMMTGKNLTVLKSYLQEIVDYFPANQVFRFDLSPQGELGMGCDWHPNVAQHAKNARELTQFLRTNIFP